VERDVFGIGPPARKQGLAQRVEAGRDLGQIIERAALGGQPRGFGFEHEAHFIRPQRGGQVAGSHVP
jgi:hypothetical protein